MQLMEVNWKLLAWTPMTLQIRTNVELQEAPASFGTAEVSRAADLGVRMALLNSLI